MCNHALGQFKEARDHYLHAEKHLNDLTKRCGTLNGPEELLKADILYNKGQTYASMAGPSDHEENLAASIKCFEAAAEL